MNKQYIALTATLIALVGGLATVVVNCLNSQEESLSLMNKAYIEQTKRHSEEVSELHSKYNDRIIDIIIKGQ